MNATVISGAARGGRDRRAGSGFDLWHELGMLGERGDVAGADPTRRQDRASGTNAAMSPVDPPQQGADQGEAARGEEIPQSTVDRGAAYAGQIAGFDPLTGLVNRRGFLVLLDVELPLAAGTGLPMAIVCLDVRHLRDINRRYGTAAGDAVLCEIATRFARLANSSVLAARVGGDEFAALLLEVGDDLQVDQQVHRFVADCAGVIQFGAELIAFQVTGGASRVPLHSDPDTALLRAEIALDWARGARQR